MCGIAGLFAPETAQPINPDVLLEMRERMVSRGPDDSGMEIFRDGRVGLAHRRLSILDLSAAGHQPMSDETGRLTIVYNGEIYNHQELRIGLKQSGYDFRSDSDTETILKLYARDGVEAFAQLRGMFALAIWDGEADTLTLARDMHGIKPLYYRLTPIFAFASQVKAILADPMTSRKVDPAGALGYAIWGSVPEPHTIISGVSALPAGHYMVVSGGEAAEPEPFLDLVQLERSADRPNTSTLPKSIKRSVQAHMLADVEVGCFLSAGVDSGAILGLMRDSGAKNVKAITLRFEEFSGTSRDEAPLASQVARLYDAHHIIETVTKDDFSASLPKIAEAMDQPSIDGVNSWFISRAAAKAGLKVALSGLGGDELLAGYSTFKTVPATHRLAKLLDLPVVGHVVRALTRRLMSDKKAYVLDYGRTLAGAYLARRSMLMPEQVGKILPDNIIDEGLKAYSPLQNAGQITENARNQSSQIAIHLLESTHYMRNQLLRDSDWAGMAHSLEIRLPLVDSEVSKVALAQLETLSEGEGKKLLANSPSTALPDSIVNRTKTGFGIPVERWTSTSKSNRLADGWAFEILQRYMASEQLSF